MRDGGTLRVLRTDRSGPRRADGDRSTAGADEFEVDTRRIVVTVDPTAEWRQMFDEAGRLMRDHFWIADMAGVDWAAELARYRPLVDAVGSHDDLVDLLWELQGELGTSHAYVMPAAAPATGPGGPGCWAPTWNRTVRRGWRVVRVLPPETSAPAARSPLSGPGVDVRAGDVILEVGGTPVDPALRAGAAAGRRGPASWSSSPCGPGRIARRRRRGPPGRGAAAALRGGAALPGLGGRAAGVRRRPLRRAGSATCTCRT